MEHPEGGEGALEAGAHLIGSPGSNYIANALSTHKSLEAAIADVHGRGALGKYSSCEPMLGLLDHHGVHRAETYRSVLEGATAALIDRIQNKTSPMPHNKLLQLLEVSFQFIKLPELRAIPLAVLGELNPVPAARLKQISDDAELFESLPSTVQHQVWEVNSQLLRRHAMPSLRAFTQETATTMHALDMDLILAPLPNSNLKQQTKPLPTLPRSKLRSGSPSLQTLMNMVIKSRKLYVEMCKFVRQYYGEKGDPAICALRSQLLMALHDSGQAAELCAHDPTHKLAWCLDACWRDKRM
eukprot:CAMPEP_0118938552 /NCGR_PEP_ID=MMETSP1169-20130426/26333_1 /TAXON_ID=36882 /ORGANISM="Pyramimonas obovata, Strain CCMP722" /LENGTH=297 /DNA_ID=CAMNT_0006882527 /DNA_START=56 /DNA_END=946 /DNA_ORIENTATION=-